MGQASAGGATPRPAPTSLTVGLVLTVTITALESLTVLSVMPLVAADLDGLDLYGWVFAGFFLTSALAIPVTAQIVDRSGLSRPFAAGLLLFGGGLLVAGLAPTMSILVAGRLLQGTGAGALNAVIYAAIAVAYGPRERGRVLALISTAWLVPAFAGPLLGSLIAQASSWRWTFLGLGAGVPLVALLVLPAVAGHDRHRADRARLSGGGFGLLPPPTIRRAALLSMLAGSALYGLLAFAPEAMTEVRGQSTFEAGLAVGLLSLSWVLSAWAHQRIAHRVALRHSIRYGLLVMGLSSPVVAALIFRENPYPVVLVAWIVVGIGAGFAFQAINLLVMAEAPPGAEGRATSSVQLANTIGAAIGTSAMGALLNVAIGSGLALGTGLGIVFATCVAVMLVSVWVGWGFRPRVPGAEFARGRDSQAGTSLG